MKFPLNLIQTEAERIESQRQCGPCTACCVLPRIPINEDPDLVEGKRGYTLCKHLRTGNCGTGCGIYSQRPQLCRDYKCLWRAGIILGDERRRPDMLGLMFTLDTEDDKGVIEAWELWDGAAENHPGRYVLDALAERCRVHIRFYGVPAALLYNQQDQETKELGPADPEQMRLGNALSLASRIAPQELVRWLDKHITMENLTANNLESVKLDLEPLRRGEPVQRYYKAP